MSQQQLSKFVSPVTQPLDDMHTHLSNLSTSYRDVNTKLKTHLNSLTTGTQSFQGSGANTFNSLIDYYTGVVEKHCQGLDSGANAAKTCSTQVTNAVDTASSSNLDSAIVAHVLGQLTLDDIILHGGSAIDPIMQDMQKTWNQMQNTWSDLQKTWADENKTNNDVNAANNQALSDLFSFNFGGLWNDNVRIWNDTMHQFSDTWHEGGDYLQLGGQGLHLLWDAIQLAWQTLKQWAEDIYQAVKNCLSFVSTIVTTATKDINTFISGIVKDEQRLMDDLQKGDYTAALNEILNDFINPELKMMGMQEMSPGQIQEMLPRGFWQWFKSLPLWAKVLLIGVVVAIIVWVLIWGAISGGGQGGSNWFTKQEWQRLKDQYKATRKIMQKIQKDAKQNVIDHYTNGRGKVDVEKVRQTNYGGGYLQAYDQNGNLIKFGGKDGLQSPLFFSPDLRNPGKHVERQTVDWSIEQINAYNTTHPNNPIKSVTLNIFTFQEPCGADRLDCERNLRRPGQGQKSPWEQKIDTGTGTNSTIVVWSAYGKDTPDANRIWPPSEDPIKKT